MVPDRLFPAPFFYYNHKIKKLPTGLEPVTPSLRVKCTTDCATEAIIRTHISILKKQVFDKYFFKKSQIPVADYKKNKERKVA